MPGRLLVPGFSKKKSEAGNITLQNDIFSNPSHLTDLFYLFHCPSMAVLTTVGQRHYENGSRGL